MQSSIPISTPLFASNEIKLILYCARTQLDSDTIKNVQLLVQRKVDWAYIVKTALQHRIMPLLCRNLQKTCPHTVPAETLEKLRTYFFTNTKRNLVFTTILFELINLFKEKGITAIPFKGPVLAESVYGDVAYRQWADLDILVHRDSILAAYQLLLSHSYHPEVNLDAEQFLAYSKTEYSLALSHKDSNVILELHWDVTGRYTGYAFDFNHFCNKLEPVTISGNKLFLFPAEDLLIYLCIHGSKDCWNNLDSICCVAELIHSRKDIDWERVDQLSEKIQCRRMLYLGLFLARQLLGTALPDQIIEKIENNPAIGKMTVKIIKALFYQYNQSNTSRISSDFSIFQLDIRERFQDKLRYILNLLFLPSRQDWHYFHLPANLSFLHYPLRPLRLAWVTVSDLMT